MARWSFLGFCSVVALAGGAAWGQDPAPYRSPYRVEFTVPPADLVGDLDRTERGDSRLEASVPFAHWYTPRTRERWQAWGPPPRAYPPPEGFDRWPVERKRERVVAAALRFRGYAYQHHHIPDWDPPGDWPWLEVGAGHNGKGVDCSNLTGFAYNLGCGLRISTDVRRQAEGRVAEGPGRRVTPLQAVELPSPFDERVKALRAGDLVFIRSRAGAISHVVIWVGPIGRGPDNTPLVVDSHGADARDAAGQPIPAGVHLRPFREGSWYNRSASHALRAFPDPD